MTATSAILAKLNAGLKRAKKEHMRGREKMATTTQQLSLSTQLNLAIQSIGKNYEILQIETDYHKRKFIESFYINSLSNVLNDKKIRFVFLLYTKICFS